MLCERLKEARAKAKMSQHDVAREIGVTQTAYFYFESGEKIPSIPVAKKIAKLFGVSLDYLVGLTD